MAWTNLTFAFGSVLTSAKMTQLDNNLDAMAEGLSGAPKHERVAGAPGSGWGHHGFYDFGDGSDGALTYDVSSSIPPGLYQHTTLQINSGFTVDMASRGPLIICATTSITINGTLDLDGMGGEYTSGHSEQRGMMGGSGAYGGGSTFLNDAGASVQHGSSQSQATIDLLLANPPITGVPSFTLADSGIKEEGDYALGGGSAGSNGGDGGGVIFLIAPIIEVGSAGIITVEGTITGSIGGGGGAIVMATSSGGLTEYSGSSISALGGNSAYDGGDGWVERIVL